MKLSVIIPVLNEEKTIKKILDKVLGLKNIYEIIVVNDGSTDKTLQILENIKKTSLRLHIISHNSNKGKGSAIRTGIKNVRGDFLIIQDADLEYNPSEFVILIQKVSPKKAVYGSRILSRAKHAYFLTYLGNVTLNIFCNLLFGSKLTDIYTCYKLIPRKIARSLKLNSQGFEIEAEITAKLLKKRVTIEEVPISYKPRSYEKGKKIKAGDAIKGALKLLSIRFGSG